MSNFNALLSGILSDSPMMQERARQERNANARSRRNAKKLAERHGIQLTIERLDGWCCWIEDSRFEGDQFCTSWDEVEGKLETLNDPEPLTPTDEYEPAVSPRDCALGGEEDSNWT